MMQERINWHLNVPVCGTLRGLKTHLGVISLRELNDMCYLLKCDSIAELTEKIWKLIKTKTQINTD